MKHILICIILFSLVGCKALQEQMTDEAVTDEPIDEEPTSALTTDEPTNDASLPSMTPSPTTELITLPPLSDIFPVACYGQHYQAMNGMTYRSEAFDAPPPPKAVGWIGKWSSEVQTISPDGQWIAQGTTRGMYLYATESLQQLWYFPMECRVGYVEFSPNSEQIAVSAEDGIVRILETASGTETQRITHNADPTAVYSSHSTALYWMDDTRLLMGGMNPRLWDVSAQAEIPMNWPKDPDYDGPLPSSLFSPSHNRQFLAIESGPALALLDLNTFALLDKEILGNIYGVKFQWSPDDQQIAITSGPWRGLDPDPAYWDGPWLYDVASQTADVIRVLPEWAEIPRSVPIPEHLAWVYALAWSPDGSMIASGDWDSQIAVWDASTLELVRQMNADAYNRIEHVVWNQDSTRIAAAGSHRLLEIWDVPTGEPLFLSETTAGGNTDNQVAPGWLPDQQHVLFHEHVDMLLVALQSNEVTRPELPEYTFQASLSPDDTLLVAQDFEHIYLWDIAAQREVLTLYEHDEDDYYSPVFHWSSDGDRILMTDKTGDEFAPTTSLSIYDVRTGDVLVDSIVFVGWHPAFNANRTRLATSRGYQVLIWDVATGELLHTLEGHIQDVLALAWSPDGIRLVSGGVDGRLILWNVP